MYSFPNLESVCCSVSSSNCCFLTCRQISQEAGWVVWYSYLFRNFPQFIVIHTVKGFGVVNKAEVDGFLELSCFYYDPTDVGNLVSGSSVFSKSSLNIWKFSVHVMLKLRLENFKHHFTSMWNECNCSSLSIILHCLSLELEWKLTFCSPVVTAEFSKVVVILSASFPASSFRIWNSSTEIPSLPLLFIVMLPNAHLTSHSRMCGSRWVITTLWLSGSWRSFFVYFFCVFLAFLLNIFCFC